MSLNATIQAKADCKSDAEKVISACKSAISAKDDEISAQSKTITDITNQLSQVQLALDKDTSALDSWYHNPVILIGIGLIVGGAGGVYLLNK